MGYYLKKEYFVGFLQDHGLISDLCVELEEVAEVDCKRIFDDYNQFIGVLKKTRELVDPFE